MVIPALTDKTCTEEKMSSVSSEKHSPAMRVQPPSAASVQLDVNGKNVSEPREESKCAASFKMGFSWV